MEKFKLQPSFIIPLRSSISRRNSGIIEKQNHSALDARSLIINSSRQSNFRKVSVRMLAKIKKPLYLLNSDSKENKNPKVPHSESIVVNKPATNFHLMLAPRISPTLTNKFTTDLMLFEEKLSRFYA